jgi:uncharacterized protein YecE (DUF72 family)
MAGPKTHLAPGSPGVFVGTSGWYYGWNPDRTLDWYISHSGLNAIELNASFYRFPWKNQILSWSRKGTLLSWAVKVNRSVTHTHQFNERGFEVWKQFFDAFAPLDRHIRFYLFQAPPRFTNLERAIRFAERIGLGTRFALEIRNAALLADDQIWETLGDHLVPVSVDSPDVTNRIFPGKVVYLRMHGRTRWYNHFYTDDELHGTVRRILENDPGEMYVFFNNDHAMLENAKKMLVLLRNGTSGS